ncbi:TetR/AcrR family transcriptional regulator [Photobacterium sp. SDRW27]|uniref:TetR/AcrR family transcriptional regulator n=1 Tax=Photobacterium obscurum TaxID=2829490 RepID=UPI0022447BC1|nr:TetR/AcrR family transcriptional regulator [Photobacterium obscurum]MCW8329504.1 TetR/AcrR family transcriptional regulator [Photobacterium obscurum]
MASNKKQQILDTALQLFVKQGIQATSTASIAKQANVATGTLFHHFASKQLLIITLYTEIKTELGKTMQHSPQAEDIQTQIRQYWQQALHWAQSHPDKLRFMQQVAHDPQFGISQQQELMATSMAFLVEQIKQAQAQQQLAALPLELVLNFCHSHFIATANLFVEQPDLASQAAYQDGAFQILWQGLTPTCHRKS